MRKTTPHIVILILLTVCCTGCPKKSSSDDSDSNTLFVDNLLGSASGTGTEDSPFATITQALNEIQAHAQSVRNIRIKDNGSSYATGETFPLNIPDGVTLTGYNGHVEIRFDSASDPAITVNDQATLSNLDLSNTLGFSIHFDGTELTLNSCLISGHRGIEMRNDSAQLNIADSTIIGCTNEVINSSGGTITINDSQFSGNGSCIENNIGSAPLISMTDCSVSNSLNSIVDINQLAAGSGETMTFLRCTFNNNSQKGIYISQGDNLTLRVCGCIFQNHASSNMHLISADASGAYGILEIFNNTFKNNTNIGSLVSCSDQFFKLYNNLCYNNTASPYHIKALDSAEIRIINNTFHTSSASQAGILLDHCSSDLEPSVARVYNNIFDGHDNPAVTTTAANVASFYSFKNNLFNIADVPATENDTCSSESDITISTLNSGTHPFSSGNINASPDYDGSYIPSTSGNLEDAGTSTAAESDFPDLDALGHDRIIDGGGSLTIDIGAVERGSSSTVPIGHG